MQITSALRCMRSASPIQRQQPTTQRACQEAALILNRRSMLIFPAAAALPMLLAERLPAAAQAADGGDISIVERTEGSGEGRAELGDIVLINYVGTLSDGSVFDSTRGGLVS